MLTPPNHIFTGVLTALFTLSQAGQVIGLFIVVAGFLAVGFSRNKDATIKTRETENDALNDLLAVRDKEILGLQQRADREHERRVEAEQRAAKCEGQIEELRPYGDAFKHLVARVERTESVIGTAIEQQGELVMKNTELAARSVEALEAMTEDLKKLVEDFGGMAERLGAGGDRPIGSV